MLFITDITARNFEEHLTYNTGSYGTPCYNGNISTQTWKTSDDNILRGYMFTYDKLNRLVNSVYGEGASFSENVNRYSESVPEYTANGAIKEIIRHGLKQNGEYGKIDNLDISLNGNQLSRVDDDALPVLRNGATDFYDNKVKTTGAEYEYDENGALTMDANRGITRIEYDHLDNPTLIQFSDGSQTEYVYTSAGEKLRTIHRTATPNITIAIGEKKNLAKEEILEADSTDYIGSFIFENSKPGKYLFVGGYYTYSMPKSGYSNYHYFLTDHLGNNRVVENENDSIEQVTHYYPFGGVYADAGLNANMQKYKYNGKELDQMHGLNSYDYGARQYYPTVPVWDRMDPLSEKYYSISPYAYCHNSPINLLDIDGMDDYKINKNGQITFWRRSNAKYTHRIYAGKNNITLGKQFVSQLVGKQSTDGTTAITSNSDDAFKFFKFAANNTKVEWSLTGLQKKNGVVFKIHSDFSLSSVSLDTKDYKDQVFQLHSHPWGSNPNYTKASGDYKAYKQTKSNQVVQSYYANGDLWTLNDIYYSYKQNHPKAKLSEYPKAYIYYSGDKRQQPQLFQYNLERSRFSAIYNPSYQQIKDRVYK